MKKILLILLVIIYILSPYDCFPDFIAGWGWVDDLLILYLFWKYFYTPWRKLNQNKSFKQTNRQSFESSQDKSFEDQSCSEINKDPHTVLQVDKNASLAEIKLAYRELANKYHPDKVLYLGEEFSVMAEKRFKEIQKAYQELISKQDASQHQN